MSDADGEPDAGPAVGYGYLPPAARVEGGLPADDAPPPPPPSTGYGPPPYGPPAGYGPPPYGQAPYGQAPYSQAPYGQAPYGQPPYGAAGGYGGGPWVPLPKAGSIATGPLPLHPMAVSDILDGIFKLLRANFRTIAIIVMTLVVPFQIAVAFAERNINGGKGLLTTFADPSTASTSNNRPWIAYVGLLVNYLMLPFVGAAIAKVAAASYLGQSIGPGEALLGMAKRAPALFGAWCVHFGAEIVGLIACGIGELFVFPLFLMLAPVIVLEDLGPWRGVRRSWRLCSRRYWPTMGTALLCGLMSYVLAQVLGAVPSVVALLIGLHWGWLLLALGSSLSALILTPIAGLTATLLYFDARIRTEGFDLQVIAAGLSPSAG